MSASPLPIGCLQGLPGGLPEDRGGHPGGGRDGCRGSMALQHVPVLAL